MSKSLGNSSQLFVYLNGVKTSYKLDEIDNTEVKLARKLTKDFFEKIRPKPFAQNKYVWAFYDRFFIDIALPYSKYASLLETLKSAECVEYSPLSEADYFIFYTFCYFHQINFQPVKTSASLNKFLKPRLDKFKTFCFYVFLISVSILSWIFFILTPAKNKIALWMGDYKSENGNMDPRLGSLEHSLQVKKYCVLLFIRTIGVRPSTVIKHFFQRRTFVIYHDIIESSLLYFLPKVKTRINRSNYFETAFLLLYSKDLENMPKIEKFWRNLFYPLNIRALLVWFLSRRTAALMWACQSNGIKAIGFMHGLSIKSYMGHEFMTEYQGPPIGPDYFGVWSDWWLKYFREYSSIYPKNAIEVSGPLKPLVDVGKLKAPKIEKHLKKLRVFFLSEAHSNPREIAPYIEQLIGLKNIEITLKVRPFGIDVFYENFKKLRPDLIDRLEISKESTPSCFTYADWVIGTHSTALLEALYINKPILFLNTKKWGDYFDLKIDSDLFNLWVEAPDNLPKKILENQSEANIQSGQKLYGRLFSQKSGVDWILQKIEATAPR